METVRPVHEPAVKQKRGHLQGGAGENFRGGLGGFLLVIMDHGYGEGLGQG